jgi:hypothetical protein
MSVHSSFAYDPFFFFSADRDCLLTNALKDQTIQCTYVAPSSAIAAVAYALCAIGSLRIFVF